MTTPELLNLREDIARVKTKRRTVALPAARTREDGKSDVRHYGESTAAAGRASLAQAVLTGDMRGAFHVRVPPPGAMLDLGPLLLALLGPKALAAATAEALEQLPPAPDAVEHANALAELDAELDALERAEEAEVTRLEGLGQRVVRRPDARPDIVLAMEVCDD